MGPLPNLIYYASVWCSTTYPIAEYLDGDGELRFIAFKCLQLLPPHHSRFSHTANQRTFACVIEEPVLYCAITDEALSRSQVVSFLEQVKQEFTSYAHAAGLVADIRRSEAHSLDIVLNPVFTRLAMPFVGIPQREKDRMAQQAFEKRMHADAETDVEAALGHAAYYDSCNRVAAPSCMDASSCLQSPSTPQISKTNSSKYKQKKNIDGTRDVSEKVEDSKGGQFEKTHRQEVSQDVGGRIGQSQRLTGSKSFKVQQVAKRMWWRSVKIALLLDLVVCMIVFGIWLGICKGFSCTK